MQTHKRSINTFFAASLVCLLLGVAAPSAMADFGISSFDGSVTNQDGSSATQAGSHPFAASTTIMFNATTDSQGNATPDGSVKDIVVALPAGFIGDPNGTPKCTEQQLDQEARDPTAACSDGSQVGTVEIMSACTQGCTPPGPVDFSLPVYNMVPPPGMPAQFGFMLDGIPTHIDLSVLPGGDLNPDVVAQGVYGVDATVTNIPQSIPIFGTTLTVWGVPDAASHDDQRGDTASGHVCNDTGTQGPPCPANAPPEPFLILPEDCAAGPLTTYMYADSWQDPGQWNADGTPDLSDPAWQPAHFVSHDNSTPPNPIGVSGCDELDFSPTISIQPDTTQADSPSGLSVDLQMPQPENPTGLNEAELKTAVVTLPAGFSVSPSAANGLAACSPAQIGINNDSEPTCPDASKIGTVQVTTPLLPDPLTGSVYVAQQTQNPFGSLLAIYIVAQADGVLIKLPGDVAANAVTGQLTTTFDNNPQLPFSNFEVDFFGGPGGVIATPDQCGSYTATSTFTPWTSEPPVTVQNTFQITSGCVSGFAPSLSAGTANPEAGAFSPFVVTFSRADTDQEFSGLSVTLPPGMLAKLAGVQECSDAQLAAAAASSGTAEQANPSCPAGSQVGTVEAGSGPGPDPFYLPGNVYLTGPYKGAPYGLAVVVPALAGPYDLGTVVVRQALYINPTTARVTAVSDPFPTILQGIPLKIRTITVDMDRPDFTLNPTSCSSMSVTGTLLSTGGLSAPLSSRFQVGGCQALGFSPKLKMVLSGKGKTRSGDHPTLTSTLTQGSGQANISLAKVTLPLSMALDPNNSQHVCSYAVAQAVTTGPADCPASTRIGSATAVTPLLSEPLSGPVYLVQGIRYNKQGQPIRTLPTLLVPLRGQVALDLRANTSVSSTGALVTTFSTIPDAPVSKFTLTITGGPRGLLVITGLGRTICNAKQVATASFGAQSGKSESSSITMGTPCAKVKKAKKHTKAKKHGKSKKHAVGHATRDLVVWRR